MENALGILKYIRNNDYIMDFLDKEDINEAIKEIEEVQLNRREWYQKGYSEAMNKTCDGCKYLDGVICKHDRGLYCVRQFEADYFVKDNK